MSSDRSVTDILTISAQRDGDRVAIALVGELDYHGAERMGVELGALIAAPATRVEMDATGLTFVDSSGLRAIMLARAKAHDIGATFRISTASLVVERVIEIAGLAGVLLATETDPS